MLSEVLSIFLRSIVPILLSVATGANNFDETVHVIVHSRPVVTDQTLVTVGDLATISGGSPIQRKQISQLDVDVLSTLKPSISIARKQIELRIRLARVVKTQPRVEGPAFVEVKLHETSEVQKRIESIVQRELASQFGLDSANVTTTLMDNDVADRLDEHLDLTRVDGIALFSTQLPLGRQLVRLELSDAQGNRASISLYFKIVVLRDVLITTQPISKGSLLTADSFQLTQRPIDDNGIRLVSLEQLAGKVAARDLAPNQLIQTNLVTDQNRNTRQVVRRNSFVDVIRNDGKINIRLRNAKVLTSGAVGDVVEVLNTRSNQKLVGVVKDKSTVVIR